MQAGHCRMVLLRKDPSDEREAVLCEALYTQSRRPLQDASALKELCVMDKPDLT